MIYAFAAESIGARLAAGSLAILAILMVAATLGGATTAEADKGECGQPVSTGASPNTSDCLDILRAAVGSVTCTPSCICDVNASGSLTTLDALLCLKNAVGQDVTLSCGDSCHVTTTTSTTTTSSSTSSSSSSLTESYDFCEEASCVEPAPRPPRPAGAPLQQRTQTPRPAR